MILLTLKNQRGQLGPQNFSKLFCLAIVMVLRDHDGDQSEQNHTSSKG